MYGDLTSHSKISLVCSAKTAGAKGLNASLNLILVFTLSFMLGCRGSANMLLLPNARGPNSILSWNHPIMCESANSCATMRHNSL